MIRVYIKTIPYNILPYFLESPHHCSAFPFCGSILFLGRIQCFRVVSHYSLHAILNLAKDQAHALITKVHSEDKWIFLVGERQHGLTTQENLNIPKCSIAFITPNEVFLLLCQGNERCRNPGVIPNIFPIVACHFKKATQLT